ncbi:dTDP-4-dehydrorhamnose reductase, partial [Candidatus Uhrbacteria bacterium CG_4_10_14_0_2_um_filter_41_7]
MYNNFLSVKSAADSIWKAVELKKLGETFNIAGKDCISRYEFSKEIAQVF